MDKLRLKKLAGLLRENVEGEEQEVREEGTPLNENEQNFLMDRLRQDKGKYNSFLKKYEALKGKTIPISVKVNVQFDWDFEHNRVDYNTADDVDVETAVEKAPDMKNAMKQFSDAVKAHMKESQIWIKETAKKHNIRVDSKQTELVWADLFIYDV